MKKLLFIIISGFLILSFKSCKEEDPYDYEVEYQDGYPNVLAGYWKAYDMKIINGTAVYLDYTMYDMVTALDPGNNNSLIVDNIYNSNQRVRTFFNKATNEFYITKGEQLEKENAQYDIETVSVDGYYVDDEDAGEVLIMYIGMYDQYGDLYDSVLTIAFRKTGFEDVDEYEYDYIFDN